MQLSVMGTAFANMLLATVISFSLMVLSDGDIEMYYKCFIIVLLAAYSYDVRKLHEEIEFLGGGK
tara:strand:+ start:283 stop:477 length:195 start_codon:yes stop_codon:yes gene_type:complete